MKPEITKLRGQRQQVSQGGTVLLLIVIGMVALLGVAALATDVGHVWAVRTELQNTVDASALAAAANLVDATNTTVTLGQARDNAEAYGLLNPADHEQIDIDRNADLTFGNWDLATGTFDTTVDLSVPDNVTAVRVDGRMDGTQNPAVSAVLARVFGRNQFGVGASAIGYLGYAGSFAPGSADLPIAIDCCAISLESSCTDVCGYLESNPYPNPTLLADGVTPATRLEFNSTPEQNACWTDFEQGPSINKPELLDIVRDGNPVSFGVQDPGIQLDNGDKTPAVQIIRDKMMGEGEFTGFPPAGSDLYDPPPGIDSWVVWFPVVACQEEDHCAGNIVVPVLGAVCFEIREINVTPDKEILGRFFCPDQRPELQCGIPGAGSGGENFGIRATRPVLVD
jgi:Flp pilus assembly protein TadG